MNFKVAANYCRDMQAAAIEVNNSLAIAGCAENYKRRWLKKA
jgi:hypothetical protein